MPQTQLFDLDTDTLGDSFGDPVPDGACVNYETCNNVPPGNGQICGECLDEARHVSSGK